MSCKVQQQVCSNENCQTKLSWLLNQQIRESPKNETYTAGKGIIVRTPDYFSDEDSNVPTVVPGTLWSNDIHTPSNLYPSKNPQCPNNACSFEEGGWNDATVAALIGTPQKLQIHFDDYDNIQNSNWNSGVFYAFDSNSSDLRCRYIESEDAFDCPGAWVSADEQVYDRNFKGAGGYPAGRGGGAGCHWDAGFQYINQTNARSPDGTNTVQNKNCECNYALKGGKLPWEDWIDQLIDFHDDTVQLPGASWAMDLAMCWINNPRDMIDMQNTIYNRKWKWNNDTIPEVSDTYTQTENGRLWWGWNEIPFDQKTIDNPVNWDGVVIKIPAGLCQEEPSGGLDRLCCLSENGQKDLEMQIDKFVENGSIIPGASSYNSHPGSSVIMARQYSEHKDTALPPQWRTWFFCDEWVSPNGKYATVYDTDNDRCYLDLL